MAMYTTVARVQNRLGNISAITGISTIITENIGNADGLIDSFLSSRYTMPITGTVPAVIRLISEHLAAYYTCMDYIPTDNIQQTLEVIQLRYDNAMVLLDRIAKGKLNVLGLDAINETARLAWSSTDDTRKFFNIDHETEWGFEEDDLDEVEDERDDGKTKIPSENL